VTDCRPHDIESIVRLEAYVRLCPLWQDNRRCGVETMTHRERVLAALNHQQPDRIPIDLGATRNTGINCFAYRQPIDYLGIDAEVQPLQEFGGARFLGLARIDERVLRWFGVDLRGIFTGERTFGGRDRRVHAARPGIPRLHAWAA
jgi:hypothetical protein